VDRKQVQEWRKQKASLEAARDDKDIIVNQVRVLSGRSRKAAYPLLEDELLEYIKKKREEKCTVTTSMIIKKAKDLGTSLGLSDIKFSRGWAETFKQRHKLVKRARTQIAQKVPEDMPQTVINFLRIAREKTYNIEKKFIISFDETPMWFDMPQNSTIDFKGVHEVTVKLTGSDKLRFTVVLSYTAAGEKLPPMVIFKLKKKPKGKFPRNIVVATAPSANMTQDLMISTFIPRVVWARPNSFFKSKGIIFFDAHRSHNRDGVIRKLNSEGLDILEIPGGTTCVLQPLDVSVNKPFKNGMQRRWEEWMDRGKVVLTKKGNHKKASYELVCEWVSETWKEISTNVLVKSFEATGLTLNPDNSENNKMSSRLQAIVENRPIEREIFLESESNHYNELDNEPDNNELDNEPGELDDYDENMIDNDSDFDSDEDEQVDSDGAMEVDKVVDSNEAIEVDEVVEIE
ncbi:9882_t:CDS:1, partial [Ambispora leptoticha]